MMGVSFRFPKSIRLHLRKEIDSVFNNGKVFLEHPFRVHHLAVEEGSGILKTGISVPRKKIRLAVSRNRIKRLTREAIRLHRHECADFLHKSGISVHVMLVYVGLAGPEYRELEDKIIVILRRLQKLHEKTGD